MSNWLPIENIPQDTRVLLNLNNYVYIGECLSKFPPRYAYDHRPIAVFEYTNNNGPTGWQNLPEAI